MIRNTNRKSTPKVIGGVVLRKNNHKKTPNYWNTKQQNVIIDVEKPGKGYKHFLKKRDVLKFIEIIPNWAEISKSLDAIVLASSDIECDGYYNNDGVVCISAWEKEMDIWIKESYYRGHKELFERLGVKTTERENNTFYCEFNEDQIKAYQLLHILLHELGHHVDRIRTKSKITAARGEQFAEDYAFKYEKIIWQAYQQQFNVVF